MCNNYEKILEHVKKAQEKHSHSKSNLKIIAVSKKQSLERMKEAYDWGLRHFGESYAQEFEQKKELWSPENVHWHFLGPLQKNKVKKVVGYVDYIHSVHELKLAQKIGEIAQQRGVTQKILLQMNLANEVSKSGFLKEDLIANLDILQKIQSLQICGLMIMPPFDLEEKDSRFYFSETFSLSQKLKDKMSPPHNMKELSMGTSHDFHWAIEEGATMVRLGSVLLGARNYES